MSKTYNWAILGCGAIANQMAQAFLREGRRVSAVSNRSYDHAVAFAKAHQIKKIYADPGEMFADPEIDIIYIATPHNTHYLYLRQALMAGKHVLCEKAITLNSHELGEIKALANQQHLIVAEAQTIYHMPLYRELESRLQAGEFGKINLITLNFGISMPYDENSRFYNKALAGGAMLDFGVYAFSCARIFLASTPNAIETMMMPAASGADDRSVIIMRNTENQMVSAALSMSSQQPNLAMISCDNAYIELLNYARSDTAAIHYTASGRTEKICAGRREDALIYELRDMETAVSTDPAIMRLDYTTDVMHMMTAVRRKWGYTYADEIL